MVRHLIFTYRFNLDRARTLVHDLPDEQMTRQPHGVVNHPAWLLGHLAASSNQLAKILGLEPTFPDAWAEVFKIGGVPSADAARFPSKEELLTELAVQHERVAAAIESADPALFGREHPSEGARKRFPTIGDYAVFMMTTHEGSHLGQIAAWRRAMDLGSATGV
jgi:hypothetical protein